MKTINIKGKEYVTVQERVKEFHRLHPDGEIRTSIITDDGKRVIVKAEVSYPILISSTSDNSVLGKYITFTGFSQAEWGKGMMGGVALEVAETSAVGRALGFANIGLVDSIATADEINKNNKLVKKTRAEVESRPPFGPGSETTED